MPEGVPPRDAAPKIAIRGLHKNFRLRGGQTVEALRDIELEIADGEFVCVIGASGCGKTTLLRIVGGFEQADAGHVEIASTPSESGLVTSTVFQEDSVFPWLTAEENVGYGLKIRKLPAARRREVVDHFIGKVGLEAFRNAYPSQLSGGMRQRVSVARAFANEPEVLLMDEPFGALDEQTRLVLQDEILRLWSQHRRTVLFVTHAVGPHRGAERAAGPGARGDPGRHSEAAQRHLPAQQSALRRVVPAALGSAAGRYQRGAGEVRMSRTAAPKVHGTEARRAEVSK
jgi:NitT/TauT family transport system ATP-binding protein